MNTSLYQQQIPQLLTTTADIFSESLCHHCLGEHQAPAEHRLSRKAPRMPCPVFNPDVTAKRPGNWSGSVSSLHHKTIMCVGVQLPALSQNILCLPLPRPNHGLTKAVSHAAPVVKGFAMDYSLSNLSLSFYPIIKVHDLHNRTACSFNTACHPCSHLN